MVEVNSLQLRIRDQHFINAGSWQQHSNDQEGFRLVTPPTVTMYDQVIAYLSGSQDSVGDQVAKLEPGEIALATVLICMRWSSYFSVLVNQDLPQWEAASDPTLSRINQSEMARINIEMSYALSRWIELLRSDRGQFQKLAHTALRLLPPTIKVSNAKAPATNLTRNDLRSHPSRVANRHSIKEFALKAIEQEQVAKRLEQIALNPDRLLANGLIAGCWRDGAIEEIHSGSSRLALPLTHYRRISRREEVSLIRTATKFVIPVVIALLEDIASGDSTTWSEQVFAYGCAMISSPHGWSLDESSREVRIDGMEV